MDTLAENEQQLEGGGQGRDEHKATHHGMVLLKVDVDSEQHSLGAGQEPSCQPGWMADYTDLLGRKFSQICDSVSEQMMIMKSGVEFATGVPLETVR